MILQNRQVAAVAANNFNRAINERVAKMIYCIEIMNFRYVKLGFTSNKDLSSRVATLQTGCPFKINPVFFINGTLKQEKEMHNCLTRAFARVQITIPPNEWYPGRTPITKHMFQLVLQKKGGVNHMISTLDRYDPSVNQGNEKRQSKGYENKKKWPSISDNQWSDDFGTYNNGRVPKLTNLNRFPLIK